MAEKEERFKTTWKGGYDKDDVLQGYQDLQEELYEEKHRLQTGIERMGREIVEKKARIAELEERLRKCDEELLVLRGNVRDNYQSYIDSYDAIGSQIFESRVYSDRVQKEADEERARILEEAMSEAKEIRDRALQEAGKTRDEAKAETEKQVRESRRQIDRQNDISRQKYDAIQQELHMLLGDFNQIQRRFMQAYRSIHDVLTDNSGDLARMRLDELTAESPTVRIPDLTAYLERSDAAGATSESFAPTKNLNEVRRALEEAAGTAEEAAPGETQP